VTAPVVLAELAGAYQLHPGQHPAITGERPVLQGERLGALLRGLPAAQVPPACAAVFTLCAHAHRRSAAAAVAAAQGLRVANDAPLLSYETARDHLRAIALDWPARAQLAPRPGWLHDAPLRIGGPALTDPAAAQQALRSLGDWLATQVLHAEPLEWLARCRNPEALLSWCQRHSSLQPAHCLALWHPLAQLASLPCEPLRVLDVQDTQVQQARLRQLATALATDPSFAQAPTWRGAARENGPWTRQRHADADLPSSAWLRLAARWRELVELAAHADAPLLQAGALALAPGEAIAWCEMARGLLLHWVRLAADGTVADYRVLAPTEWNFHPQGALARALEALAPGERASAEALAAAFDPCVPFSLAAP
jgi:hypothetical protein